MIYTDLTNKALKLMYNAHAGQVDKAGVPYCFHPYEVASHCTTEYSVCAALLHDVVEDTSITLEQLSQEFPKEIIDAVACLTHAPEVDYATYIRGIAKNPIAREVKVHDLEHNLQTERLVNPTREDIERHNRYTVALVNLR